MHIIDHREYNLKGDRGILYPRINVGYVSLNDAAPFIVAQEKGFFEKYGLDVNLTPEIGWATIRDKIEYGDLDAAQALGPIPFAMSLGLGNRHAKESIVSLVTSVNGNAITLARRLGDNIATCVHNLKKADFSHRTFSMPTLAVVSLHSSHYFLLRIWLKKKGINPDKDIHFVVLPPSHMPDAMAGGYIDGFCAGDPWNTMAEHIGTGIIVASSLDIAPGHVEKVLLVSHSFAMRRMETHIGLIAALLDACEYCQSPSARLELAKILHDKGCINCPINVIERGLSGFQVKGNTFNGSMADDFLRFDDNRPSSKHADWILSNLKDAGMLKTKSQENATIKANIFAEEFFEEAEKLRGNSKTHTNKRSTQHESYETTTI
ncbi:MAG: ABC transporter substrate-binding protein [Opitutales bacterium]|nr:ABC transporter substrate-binding protein [Opitutales bacterium]